MIKKVWPISGCSPKKISSGYGRFWADRGDRYHMGTDIYAPAGSKVLSCEDGKVIKIGIFTDPEEVPYWNKTYYILIMNRSGTILNYGELRTALVKEKQVIKSGQVIGTIGQVLNPRKITSNSPKYIHRLVCKGNLSMLHLEMYSSLPEELIEEKPIICFKNMKKPDHLLDSGKYLDSFFSEAIT